jgi:1-aminocyclopropane-1-carboxylate deaminase
MLRDVTGFSHVVCAVGTGTTFAGLVNAAAQKGMQAEGICVLKGAEAIKEDILPLIQNNSNWHLHHRFHEGGYAKTTPELLDFVDAMAAQTGLLLDQVYTGKMMKAVVQLVEEKYYTPSDKLLLIHTGGLLGLLSRWR